MIPIVKKCELNTDHDIYFTLISVPAIHNDG